MILNEYSKTAWVNGASPDINKANLDNLEQGVYDVTAKAMELAAYETNAAASATAASASAVSAAASAAVYTDLATVVANHAKYSTTEEVVIGTYDGKPLYRSCLSIASLPNMTSTSYPHGIANIEKIFIGNNSHATDGTNYLPLPFSNKTSTDVIGVYPNPTNVVVDTGMDRSGLSATIFLEYTKTTD